MALTGYLTIEGNNQGKIEGDCVQKGREDSILVYGFEHQIEIPTDIHTGLPTGQRIHKPITIEKKYFMHLLIQESFMITKTMSKDYYRDIVIK